ncbi:major facilitator superfamily domain-containing protein [Chytriomyces cf. hyalinus JEL632]|nr:major facilitator superfamily domain-containing protein [Chytriomyces cf. hyalinus JEL632]
MAVSSIKRYSTLVSSCVSMATAGSLFSFSVMSGALKERMSFTSADINTVSGVGNSSLYLSFLFVGPLFDYAGAQFTMLFALITFSIGYLLMYLAYIGSVAGSTGLMSFYYFIVGIGSTCAYMGAIGGNIVNFSPQISGRVVGLLLLWYGLSGTIYSQIYYGLYLGKTEGYLLFLTLSVGIVNGICCFITFKVPYENDGKVEDEGGPSEKGDQGGGAIADSAGQTEVERRRSSAFRRKSLAKLQSQTSIGSIPELLMQSSAVQRQLSEMSLTAASRRQSKVSQKEPGQGHHRERAPTKSKLMSSITADNIEIEASLETVVLPPIPNRTSESASTGNKEETPDIESVDVFLSPLDILKSPIFWLYASTFITMQGLTYMTNFLSILEAAEGAASVAENPTSISLKNTTHVTVMSVFQALGRVVFSLALDAMATMNWRGLDRSWLLLLSNMFVLLPTLLLASGSSTEATLYICSVFTGFGFGGGGACFPALTRDFFGMQFYGTACGFVMAGVPIGIISSNLIFGVFYDKQTEAGASTCYGSSCYSTSFQILLFIQCIALVCSAALCYVRSKK